jgi:hypothetical protein
MPVTCDGWRNATLTDLGVRYVAVHAAFYRTLHPACVSDVLTALRAHDFRQLATDGDVMIFARAR